MQTYSIPNWLKITMAIVGIPMVASFLAIVVAPAFTDTFNKVYFLVGPAALAMAGLCTFALLQLNEQLSIDDYSIKYNSRFINRELLLTDIAGYRYYKNCLMLEPLPERGKRIQITRHMSRFNRIEEWVLNRYPDLDKAEAQAIFDNRGAKDSRETVAKKARQAKLEIYSLNGLIMALIAVSLIFPTLKPAAYYVLMVCPLPAIFLLYRYGPLVKLGEKTESPMISMDLPLLLSGGSMIIQALYVNILRYDRIWPPAIAIATVLGALLIAVRWRFLKRGVHYVAMVTLLITFFGHGYATIVFLNQLTDKKAPVPYKARIQRMWASQGKTTTYHLELAPWGPQHDVDDVTTSEDFYDSVQVNDTIAISLHPGGLEIPYLDVGYYSK
ncbi:hypothetical protein F0L74_10670 [Chitinophaga agrisoli]|uniref:Uncharacterized protein n=1 Tax=Chitinophaga agrisoli TaxID=2607653 RepID=A0A5B2VXT5_9BACT|nr:hypothetical protein [Chitinophaga agrisoli]KAA2242976.1 hypothetical protein F0L74_10670 [Chitinophaga agrisoli]